MNPGVSERTLASAEPWEASPPPERPEPNVSRDCGAVRAMRQADIPALVALRQQVFRLSERSSPRELAAYLGEIFFNSPMGTLPAAESLVFEDGDGRLTGFLGVIPRTMYLGTRPLSVRVGTQLMVAPDAPGLVGRRLIRTFCDGPQDLIVSDTANDAARRLWESIGGHVATAYSLSWYRALRPTRSAAMRAAKSFGARALALAARPLLSLADAMLAARSSARPPVEPTDRLSDLVVERDLPIMTGVIAHWHLRPSYSASAVAWTLAQAERKRGCGPAHARLIRDAGARPVGWFIYCGARGAVGQVVQIGARKHDYARVLAHLFADAHARGVVGVTGRLEPLAAPALTVAGAQIFHEGPWVLAHARERAIISAIESGKAFVSRLDGEWWLGF